MLKLKRSKKGNIIDLFYIGIFVLAFSLIVIMGKGIFTDINTDFQADPTISDASKDILTENYDTYDSLFDNIFMFVFIGLGLAVVVSAFFIQSHPLFYFVSVVIFSILTFVTALFSNVYEEIILDPTFATAASGFTFMNHFMAYLPLYIIVFSIVVAIVLYSKR